MDNEKYIYYKTKKGQIRSKRRPINKCYKEVVNYKNDNYIKKGEPCFAIRVKTVSNNNSKAIAEGASEIILKSVIGLKDELNIQKDCIDENDEEHYGK